MDFLYLLESIRNPVCDFFFETVTHLGEETLFLVISIIFFWCVNKREGYFILITGLFGTLINQALKLVFRIPRPWVIDPEFTVVGDAKLEATGYSFPSGHTQNISTTFGAIAAYNAKRRWVSVLSVSVVLLVAFSRMYLGVHTPLDVGVSLLVGLLLVLILRPFFVSEERFKKALPVIVILSVVLSAAYLVFVTVISSDHTLDAENLSSGMKNAYTLFGCTAGLVLVYFVDTKLVKFDTGAAWYAQIIKAVLGFGVILAIKEGLRVPLEFLCLGEVYIARAVRYFLIVLFAGALWPMSFRYFARLRIGALDRLGDRVASLFSKKSV